MSPALAQFKSDRQTIYPRAQGTGLVDTPPTVAQSGARQQPPANASTTHPSDRTGLRHQQGGEHRPAAVRSGSRTSAQPIKNIVVVAETDMIDDRFWGAKYQDLFGQRVIVRR